MANGTISIRYINNTGAGVNVRKEIAAGTTIEQLFDAEMRGQVMQRFNIRINNRAYTPGQVLQDGDTVSIIPGKYDGGALGDFVGNLKLAAEIGRALREVPTLAEDLAALAKFGRDLQAAFGSASPAPAPAPAPETFSAARPAANPARSASPIAPAAAASAAAAPASGATVLLAEDTNAGQVVPIEPGETFGQFFARRFPGVSLSSRFIKVNDATIGADDVLNHDDFVEVKRQSR